MLLGEQTASKTVGQGSNPCARAGGKQLCRCGSITARRRPRKAEDVGATPTAGPLSISDFGFRIEIRNHKSEITKSLGCAGCIRPCEGRGPGSTPGGD